MQYFVIGGIVKDKPILENEQRRFENSCITIGKTLCDMGHSLIVCSPFNDSADYWVLEGFARGSLKDNQVVEFHFVDVESVREEIDKLQIKFNHLRFIKVPHASPSVNNSKSIVYSWLLCQLEALESCHTIVTIGGNLDGSANMLLLLAESRRKKILPLSFLGGAAAQSFHRSRYELQDRLKEEYILLQDEQKIEGAIKLGEKLSVSDACCTVLDHNTLEPNIFISYPRAQPTEADYIETLLRRRNLQVFRDESNFGAGHDIPKQIREAIFAANIFIAVWCREYACSPWCFDELELALDRQKEGNMKIWIICTDDTRIVPTRARNLHYYSANSREEIERCILKLIEQEVQNTR